MEKVLNDKSSFYRGLTQTPPKLTFFRDIFHKVRLKCRKSVLSVPKQAGKLNFAWKNSQNPACGNKGKGLERKKHTGGLLFIILLKVRMYNHTGKVCFNSIMNKNNAALLQYPQNKF